MRKLCCLLVFILTACGSSTNVSPSHIFNLDHAALVAIEVVFSTTITSPIPALSDKSLILLKNHSSDSSPLGLVTELAHHPLDYLTDSTDRSSIVETSYAGSGILIGSKGTVLTSQDLLYPSVNTLNQLFIDSLPASWLNADLDALTHSLNIAAPISATLGASLIAAERDFLSTSLKLGNITRIAHATVTATYGLKGPGKSFASEIISMPSDKVGLLKIISGPIETPAAMLSQQALHTGDIAYVFYYTFPSTSNTPLSITLDSAKVTSLKNSHFSLSLKNVDGMGGGAIFNLQGEIVGVVDVINPTPSTTTGITLEGISSVLKSDKAEVSTSSITSTLALALDEYNLHHDSVANKLLHHVDIKWPKDPVITKLIVATDQAVKEGKDQTPFWYCYFNSSLCS